MIENLTGRVTHCESGTSGGPVTGGFAVIDVGGVGFGLHMSSRTADELSAEQTVTLLTRMVVKEDDIRLYGFSDRYERSCFDMLISVSRIGAKTALSVLSSMPPPEFAECVAGGDDIRIARAKGVGIKAAQRIVLELKDKMAKAELSKQKPQTQTKQEPHTKSKAEAMQALMVLGFKSSEISQAINGVDSALPTQEIIKQTLKFLRN